SFKKALEFDSTFAMAYSMLAMLEEGSEEKKMIARAVQYLDKASQKEKHYIRSLEAYISGNYNQYVKELQELVKRYPEEKRAFYWLGAIYYRQLGKPEEAVRQWTKAIEVDPLYKDPYNVLAYAYNDIGDFEKSIWAINKYISLAPDEANPYDSRGELYGSNGKIDKAIESFKKALEIKPDFYMSWQSLGHMYVFQKRYAEAEKCYEKLLSSSDKYTRSDGRKGLALIPLQQGKFDKALSLLDQGIAAGKMERVEEWTKHLLKASIYAEKEDIEQALKETEESIELYRQGFPDKTVGFRHVYVQLLAENNELARAEEAADAFKRDIEEKGQFESGFYWIAVGCIEFSKGNFEASAKHMETAAEGLTDRLSPVYFRLHFLLARAYLESGRLGEAVAEYEKLLSNYSAGRLLWAVWSVKAHYYLGQAYEKSGWNDKASEQYEEFLDIWKDADPGIAAIEDARERLARLKSKS
ncbi:tetratricopeptide repeat protein, partial [bacterium]|nr:tetratricopeptide repeat protein [bacterium]